MAFSVLRNVVKCSKSVYETNALGPLKNAVAKFDHTKSLIDLCKCANPTFSTIKRHHANVPGARGSHVEHAKNKQLSSESESDSDLEGLGHRGESEFWRRKIRTFHGILDVNNDGVISYDDFNLLANRFINLGHLTSKHTTEFRNTLKELWEKRWGEITPYNLVTVEQFLEDMHHVLNDKRLVRRAHSFLPYLFRAVDKDQSGEICIEEYKLFFECLGHSEEDAVLAFRAIDSNGDGKVNLKEFVKHGRDFFLTEDENRISKYFWGPLIEH